MTVALIAFVVIFFGMRYFMPKPAAPTTTTPEPVQQQAAQIAQPGIISPAATPAVAKGTAVTPANVHMVAAQSETETIVENELYRIHFSNRGGQVTSWQLKRYKDSQGKPLDLVSADAAKQYGYPLSLYTYDAGLNAKLDDALYVSSATGTLQAPATLSFDYSDGVYTVHKSFRFDGSYLLHADVSVTQNGIPVRALVSWPAGFGDQHIVKDYSYDRIDTTQNGSEDNIPAKKISSGATLNGPFDWAGVSDLYFAAVLLPDTPQTATMVSLSHPLDVKNDAKTVQLPVLGAAMGDNSGHTQLRIYVGPKLLDVLKTVHATEASGAQNGPSLEKLVDFGFWGPIAKVLFLGLHVAYDYLVHSWGWAIILVTVIINAVLLPLRITTMKSALKMQRIQPQMDAIKEKYKKYKINDPKRNDMNVEIMALQKANGVNMFGGCIPMLIQLPLLFAFYSMLLRVIELRQAHWFWLPDLSQPDPYHILPIVMVVSQVLTQLYTPSPGVDPAQQKMMAFTMPAFSGFITWNYASGLALYWATGNLIMIAQQSIMNQTSLGREMREIAARRARRKGNVIQGRR